MANKTPIELKPFFEQGDRPSQGQFGDLIDSCYQELSFNSATNEISIKGSGQTVAPPLENKVSLEALRLWKQIGSSNDIKYSSGNVGIGSAIPSAKLQITESNAVFLFDGSTSTSGYTTTFGMNDTGLSIGHDSSLRRIDLSTGSSPRLTIQGDGKVGIGTVAPSAKLHVLGDIKLQNGATVNEFSTDGTLGDDSDTAVPTEKAVRTYVNAVTGTFFRDVFSASLFGADIQTPPSVIINLVFNHVNYDNFGVWDGTVFTAHEDGAYEFTAHFVITDGSAEGKISLAFNLGGLIIEGIVTGETELPFYASAAAVTDQPVFYQEVHNLRQGETVAVRFRAGVPGIIIHTSPGDSSFRCRKVGEFPSAFLTGPAAKLGAVTPATAGSFVGGSK